jgi:hypothetical protein
LEPVAALTGYQSTVLCIQISVLPNGKTTAKSDYQVGCQHILKKINLLQYHELQYNIQKNATINIHMRTKRSNMLQREDVI